MTAVVSSPAPLQKRPLSRNQRQRVKKRRKETKESSSSHSSALLDTSPSLMGNCVNRRRGSYAEAASPTAVAVDETAAPPKNANSSQTNTLKAEHRARRRLSLIHAEPIVHDVEGEEKPRGTTKVLDKEKVDKLTLEGVMKEDTHAARVSIAGAAAYHLQGNFENKIETWKGNVAQTYLNEMGIGHACRKGLKPESPNQDDFFIYHIEDIALYGVFDGHGPFGHDISNFVQTKLPALLWNHESFEYDLKAALKAAFAKMQTEIERVSREEHLFEANLSGCTATVVIHDRRNNTLTSAHVGDSRAVLARRRQSDDELEAVDLTEDHKPTLPAERQRIEACGGEVKRLEGDIPYRVFLKGKCAPGLAMSRAFGDIMATQAGVSSEPDINSWVIQPGEDIFIIICSDGVWEFISSQQAVSIVASHSREQAQAAADNLAKSAWNQWITEEGDVVDDITVEVVYLAPP